MAHECSAQVNNETSSALPLANHMRYFLIHITIDNLHLYIHILSTVYTIYNVAVCMYINIYYISKDFSCSFKAEFICD